MPAKKKKVETLKTLSCPRCSVLTAHTLYNGEAKTYVCNVCGTIHTKENSK